MTNKTKTKRNKKVSANAEPMNTTLPEETRTVEANPVNFDVRGVSEEWMVKIGTAVREATRLAKPFLDAARISIELFFKKLASKDKVLNNIERLKTALERLDKALDNLKVPGVTDQMSRSEIHACVKRCLEQDKELQHGLEMVRNFTEENA